MAIAEFPHLCIDDFRVYEDRPLPELCILSHMHEDHTLGLARKSYHGPVVYCTAATKAMVLNFRSNYGKGPLKYNHLRKEIGGKEILQALDLDKPYRLDYPGGPLQVTLIDANHCPGAAMVLVQSPHNTGPSVLFTGDVRCERWHLDALIHNPALFVYSKHLCDGPDRQWLSLYVDDTFSSHADPFKSYGDNYNGILQLATLLKQYPKQLHFCIADRTTGYEEVLIALSQQLHTKVHMDAYFYSMYSAAALTSPLAAKLIERSSTELDESCSTRLHFCDKHNGCPMRDTHSPTVYFKPCIQPSEEDVHMQNMRLPFDSIRPSALRPFEGSSTIYLGPEQRYYKDSQSQQYYPLFPWFYFSRHSSFPELQGLRDLFHCTTVRSLQGVELASLTLLPHIASSSLKRSYSMAQEPSVQTEDPSADFKVPEAATRAHKAASMKNGMLPFYKKQMHTRPKRQRRTHSHTDDDDTDADETERHQMLELLNRRSVREKSNQKWRASILESEKQLDSRSDTQEFDEREITHILASCSSENTKGTDDDNEINDGDAVRQLNLPTITATNVAVSKSYAETKRNTICEEDMDISQDADSSSLLSPPPSPCCNGSSKKDHHDFKMTGQQQLGCATEAFNQEYSRNSVGDDSGFDSDVQVVDETPTSESLLAALEHQIRADPSCWFSFTFDFVN